MRKITDLTFSKLALSLIGFNGTNIGHKCTTPLDLIGEWMKRKLVTGDLGAIRFMLDNFDEFYRVACSLKIK